MMQPSVTKKKGTLSSSTDSKSFTIETASSRLPAPLERLSAVYEEKTIVNELQELLNIDDEDIFDDIEQQSDESDDEVVQNQMPSIRASSKSLQRGNSKIPDRSSSKSIPAEVSKVLEDSLKQKRMSAQQLFEIFKNLRLEEDENIDSRSDSSDDSMYNDPDYDIEEIDNELDEYGGVYNSKLEMPSSTIRTKQALDIYYSEYVSTHREITPVEEVDEEWKEEEEEEEEDNPQQNVQKDKDNDMKEIAETEEMNTSKPLTTKQASQELQFNAFQEKLTVDEDGVPNYILMPTDQNEATTSRRASLVSMTAPSLVSEDSHTSANNSLQSFKSPTLLPVQNSPENIPSSDLNTKESHYTDSTAQQSMDEKRYDTVNDISSLYATAPDEFINDKEQQARLQTQGAFLKGQASKTRGASLYSDVQRLSQLRKALSTSTLRQVETPINSSKVPSHLEKPLPQPTIDNNPYKNMYLRRTPVTSLSLIHDKNSLKVYRRMATKTNDRNIQYTYTKYLMQLVSFYAGCNQRDIALTQTRNRLQEEAEYWIDRLAKSNYGAALYTKGQWHRHCGDVKARGIFVGTQYKKANHEKAFKCFQLAAKYGSIEAYYELAECWMVRKDYKKTLACYKYAASKNHVLSLYKLANIHLRGLLKQQKAIRKGLIYLRQAADANQPDCARPAYDFACILLNDLKAIDLESEPSITSYYIAPDVHQAAYYLQKADKFGLVSATFRLGQLLMKSNQKFAPNEAEAFKCFAKAANRGHEDSMIKLSQFYKSGIPGLIRPHLILAFQWCQKAAENGNEEAEYILGYEIKLLKVYNRYST
ncbi:hypothetical protein BDF20DRAFT_869144 [Mycotypha africana]|uniref:uncharacterized protein n=1 Tax=Mycotypha africana TaxID=64632 RepID=UPI0022FFCB59|nr:uncharacterized protein BDF20DRAFT_869144 [Mycotypha africana]KAI8979372.1 hypothetical protein BDF20DRAFT_869144 [Mycotypha africana]